MSETIWRGTAKMGGVEVPVEFHFGDTSQPVHGGTWNARYDLAGGKITKAESDQRVADARLERRKRRSTGHSR